MSIMDEIRCILLARGIVVPQGRRSLLDALAIPFSEPNASGVGARCRCVTLERTAAVLISLHYARSTFSFLDRGYLAPSRSCHCIVAYPLRIRKTPRMTMERIGALPFRRGQPR